MRLRNVSLKPMHIALLIASLLYLIAGTASGAPTASGGRVDLHLAELALLAAHPAPAPAAAVVVASPTPVTPSVAIAFPAVIYPKPPAAVRRIDTPHSRDRYGSNNPGATVLLPIVRGFF